jgi:hypothetical protein
LRGRVHPCHFVTPDLMGVVDLWMRCRGGDFTPAQQPFAGGVAEQPSWLIAAFDVIQASVAALQKKGS